MQRTPVAVSGLLLCCLFLPCRLHSQTDRDLALAAEQLWSGRQWHQAVRYYQAVATRYPLSPLAGRAHVQLGVHLKYQGRWQEAISEYEQAIRRFPRSRAAHDAKTGIAAIHYFREDFQRAVDLWREVLAETSDWDQIKYCSYMIRDARRRMSRPGTRRATPCGPASLETACRLLGVRAAPAEIRSLLPAGPDGVSMEDMLRAARAKGLEPRGVRLNIRQLRTVRKPVIAFVQPGHFVVVTGADSRLVDYIDPALRNTPQRKPLGEFARSWDGSALIFSKTERAGVIEFLTEASMRSRRGRVCYCCPPSGFGTDNPGAAYDNPQPQCGPGLPGIAVNMVNLNLVVQDLDFRYGGRGPAVYVLRTYNADDPQEGPFGRSWTFNYGITATENPNQTVDVRREGGRIDHFVRRADGSYAPPAAIYDSLTKSADGTFALTLKTSRAVQQFNPAGRLARIVDRNGNAVALGYDSSARLVTITDAAGRVTRFDYGPNNKIISVTDPSGRRATYEYDVYGHLIKTVDMAGNVSTFVYDTASYLISVTTPPGTTQIAYDTSSDGYTLASLTDPLGNVRAYGTKDSDYRTKVADAMGHIRLFENSHDGQTERRLDALGNTTAFAFDAAGNLTKVTDPAGATTHLEYDARGNVTRITDPLGNSADTTYDAQDHPRRYVDRLGRVRQYTYDAKGNLAAVLDPLGARTVFEYSPAGQIVRLTDARGSSRLFTYDDAGNLTKVTNPLGAAASYAYDSIGRVTKMTRRNGDTIQYAYDGIDRILSISYPDGNVQRFSYGCCGPTTVSDKNGSVAFEYDSLGQVVRHARQGRYLLEYSYDAAGNQLSVTYPGGKVVKYGYDEADRLVSVSDWLGNETRYAYDGANHLISSITTNGPIVLYRYDGSGRLKSLLNYSPRGELIAGESYERDAEGNITSMNVSAPVLPVASPSDTSLSYGSDNRILSAGSIRFEHDASGNMVRMQSGASTTTLAYDYRNMLATLALPGVENRYQYDLLGNRAARSTNGAITHYIAGRWPHSEVYAETDQAGNVLAYYVYGLGLISKITADGKTYFYCFDSIGNTSAVLDSGGAVVNAYAYEPYGAVHQRSTEKVVNLFKYGGRLGIIDEGNGFLHMRARFYSTVGHGFVSPDPAGTASGTSQYAYAAGNPINRCDPTGLVDTGAVVDGIECALACLSSKAGKEAVIHLIIELLTESGWGKAAALASCLVAVGECAHACFFEPAPPPRRRRCPSCFRGPELWPDYSEGRPGPNLDPIPGVW